MLHSSQNSITSSNLHDYLPGRDDVKEWRKDGPPQEYKGEDHKVIWIKGGVGLFFKLPALLFFHTMKEIKRRRVS